jgi:hypothetical protein
VNPAELLAPASPVGAPAPYWLLVAFKVLGFTLHLLAVHLWWVGLAVALGVRRRGGEFGQRWAKRLLKQMPLIIAAGVNLGIVPLLFLQVSDYRVFYAATILMAWPWLAVIGLLLLAYSGVHAYVTGMAHPQMAAWRRVAGWAAVLCFSGIGFLFTNAMSLMTRLDAWPQLWGGQGLGGATRGLALNLGDPTLWPRWLLVMGLGLTTTAVHVIVDAGVFSPRDEAYRRWAARFALRLQAAGVVWFAACGAWYVFGTWQDAVRNRMLNGPLAVLTLLTAAGPGFVWLLCLGQRRGVTRRSAWGVLAAQLAVLALNAVSRQLVQNAELARWYDVTAEPVRAQWSPLGVFLIFLAGGIALIAWSIGRAAAASRGHLRPDPLVAEIEVR